MKYRNTFRVWPHLRAGRYKAAYNQFLLWVATFVPWRLKKAIASHVISKACFHAPDPARAFQNLSGLECLQRYNTIHDPALDANCKDFNGGSPLVYSGSRPHLCRYCGLESYQHENPKINALGRLVRKEADKRTKVYLRGECYRYRIDTEGTGTYPPCLDCGGDRGSHPSHHPTEKPTGLSGKADPWLQ